MTLLLTCLPMGQNTGSRSNAVSGASGSGFFQGGHLCTHHSRATPARAAIISVEAKYRGKGTDLSRVPQFMRHDSDTGSTEVQISRLSARITQLTQHLKANKKDYASRRGLEKLLSRRRHFMTYLYKIDRSKYENVISELNVRPLRIQAGRGVVVKATEEGLVVDTEARQAGSEETAV